MRILAIDTSTSMATVAIAVDGEIVAETLFNADRTLSVRLIPETMHCVAQAGLELDQIDLFASSVGPGSFTGVRGGVATIQGLALATGKPCVGFSSLMLLAMNFSLSSLPVCPLLDARKSEVYAALYDCSGVIPVSRVSDCVVPPAVLLDTIYSVTEQKIIFTGEGAHRYRETIIEKMGERAVFAEFPLRSARAAHGTLLAQFAFHRGETLEPAQLLPVYLRASEAELNRK
ncbi:MAG TPA: tRNA (adenosine(37)-N6)-threonylcarbamoyltransferase complex dimerization subunit type 1 TsaB [Desulfuromonadales bacterium]|nr:tRNA (adenosine(37)-N6)-threonylcarbamoyltransferase complex dimerization subunit type 1 TsaB [Desulfuromonadales bacterium]